MENYSYASNDSSPRSREIEFENTPPWDIDNNNNNNNYKVKFMCSYGGKIQPRPHDNQLSYVGGETKIFSVDRNIKYSVMQAKLSALCEASVTFKYQLPGEDLDALISVTNDDDLEHMMNEYDRLFRASAKPARMRLFLFPVTQGSVSEHTGNTAASSHEAVAKSNVDFLFGLERGMQHAPPQHHAAPVAAKLHHPVPEPVAVPGEYPGRVGSDDRVIGSDHVELQREMQRMQLGSHEQQAVYRRKSEDNITTGYSGEYYVQKMPEKMPSGTVPLTVPPTGGYWSDKQLPGGFSVPATTGHGHQEQPPVYVIPGTAPGQMYHAPTGIRPMTGQPNQGFYAMQRMGQDVYREQPVYNVAPPPSAGQPVSMPPHQPPKMGGYPDVGVVRSGGDGSGSGSGSGVGASQPNPGAYAHVGYDSAGRQVYYTAAGGMVVPPPPTYQGVAHVGGDVRTSGGMSHDGKVVVTKVTQGSV